MGKKYLACMVLCFSLLLTVTSLAAEDVILLETGELSVNSWNVHYSRHSFAVTDPGFAILKVTKTTPDKDIDGGFLFLNRRAIPLKHFFKKSDLVFEKKNQT